MHIPRRDLFRYAAMAGAAALGQTHGKAASKPGMPGPFPGLVVGVEHPGSIINGEYQPEPVRMMIEKGMTSLTGAPSWAEAWRSLFEKGDVVGIKVSPVGGRTLCSDGTVLHAILAGLKEAEIPPRDVIVYNRYREETLAAGIDKWVPDGVRMEFASPAYNETQLDMEGYDRDHYMEMALIKPGENWSDPPLPALLRRQNRVAADQQVHQSPGPQAPPIGGCHQCLEEHVPRHGEQRQSQPPDADRKRMRDLHSVGRESAGDS